VLAWWWLGSVAFSNQLYRSTDFPTFSLSFLSLSISIHQVAPLKDTVSKDTVSKDTVSKDTVSKDIERYCCFIIEDIH
jgi:hypothetical protein